MAVDMSKPRYDEADEQVDSYERMLRNAKYYMKLQEGFGQTSFRLRMKSLYPILGVHTAAQFTQKVNGLVSDDSYTLTVNIACTGGVFPLRFMILQYIYRMKVNKGVMKMRFCIK